jgi:hypothetical protein
MMERREGTKHIYTLQPGEKWTMFRDLIIVAHPDRQPKIIHPDGSITELKLEDGPWPA